MTTRPLNRKRRGTYAVEFALTLPLLALMLLGTADLAWYLNLSDWMVAAVTEGARRGALADIDDGEDPLLQAQDAADDFWLRNDLPGTATFTATFAGLAAPDERLTLHGEVTVTAWNSWIALSWPVEYDFTMRVQDQ